MLPTPGSTRRPLPRARLIATAALLAGLVLSACSTNGSSGDASAATTTKQPASTTAAPDATVPTDRPIEVHVPKSYNKDTPAPLLILLHGFGASGKLQEGYLGLTKPADAAGMLYVYPDGTTNVIGKQFWNATDACCAGPKAKTAVDDSAYLASVIAQVKSQYNVDPKRVFIVGHSNGGFMSYRMACDHADEIAAIVSLEGATFDDPSACKPSEPVSTLEVHGRSDTTIFYDGGKIVGTPYPGAEQTVKTWATYDGCSTTPDDPAPASRQIVRDLPPAEVTSYSDGCKPGGHAELWSQPEGVHIPPWSETFSQQVIDWLQAHPKP